MLDHLEQKEEDQIMKFLQSMWPMKLLYFEQQYLNFHKEIKDLAVIAACKEEPLKQE